jgi:hypothetical protein
LFDNLIRNTGNITANTAKIANIIVLLLFSQLEESPKTGLKKSIIGLSQTIGISSSQVLTIKNGTPTFIPSHNLSASSIIFLLFSGFL